jgi:hypothetical protein
MGITTWFHESGTTTTPPTSMVFMSHSTTKINASRNDHRPNFVPGSLKYLPPACGASAGTPESAFT